MENRAPASSAMLGRPAIATNHHRRREDQATPIRVLVIDGHPVTRGGMTRLIDQQPDMDCVAECGDAAEALKLVALLKPDVVTIDASLPDRDGLELLRELRDRQRELGIVILAWESEDDVLLRALDNGASAFVSKLAPAAELLSAMRHAAIASASFSAVGLAQAMRSRPSAARPMLSPREAQVLSLLQAGRSVPEVAAVLFVSLSTAKTYVGRLYEKLGASNRAQALMAAVGFGLLDSSAATAATAARRLVSPQPR
jgi:DNA-binding NarL/FixJ family response regulator